MTSENMTQAYEIISKLNVCELSELSSVITDTLIEKRQRFTQLVMTLEETLDEIFKEFPNASIPLSVSFDETIDIMDYIVPQDFVTKCKMGD